MGASCHKCRTSPRLRKRYTNGRGTDYVTVNAVHSLWPRSNTSVYSLFTFGAVSTPILASRSNFSLSRKFLHVSFLSLSFFIPPLSLFVTNLQQRLRVRLCVCTSPSKISFNTSITDNLYIYIFDSSRFLAMLVVGVVDTIYESK